MTHEDALALIKAVKGVDLTLWLILILQFMIFVFGGKKD